MTQRKRLHISPLKTDLLPIILTGTLRDKATDISLHTLQTFPEKNFGYVELPIMEAEKLRKKLNGSTLKGSKMRVEEARPKKARKGVEKSGDESPDARVPQNTRKTKAVKEEGVVAGHELHDRKVKRGWTEPSQELKSSKRHKEKVGKKPRVKSSSLTGEAECLFKTKLPSTALNSEVTRDGKIHKRKREDSTRDIVVHEFANTTKHASFLRDEAGAEGKKTAVEYIEGEGWVDEDGKIVEAGPKRRRSKSQAYGNAELQPEEAKKSGSRRSSRLEAPSIQVFRPERQSINTAVVDEETSSSGTSSSEDDSESDSPPTRVSTPPAQTVSKPRGKRQKGLGACEDDEVEVDRVERLSITRSSGSPPQQQLPPTSVPSTQGVHPLESLFKRPKTATSDSSHTPKKPNLEVSTSFSFFDAEFEDDGSQGLTVPQTPFTQQDIRQRRQRSAAPTPDTAAPGKTFGHVWEATSDISEGGEEDETGADTAMESKDKSTTPDIKGKPESEFSKWFWEHRGENNRAWKRRRREAAKEKRQKENKERRG